MAEKCDGLLFLVATAGFDEQSLQCGNHDINILQTYQTLYLQKYNDEIALSISGIKFDFQVNLFLLFSFC